MIVGKDNNEITRPRDAQMSEFTKHRPSTTLGESRRRSRGWCIHLILKRYVLNSSVHIKYQ